MDREEIIMRRRTFLSGMGLGWLLTWAGAIVPTVLAACGRPGTSGQKDPEGYQPVGTIADLDQKGQLLVEQTPPILVLRNPSNPQTLVAVNPTCTHQGCLVAWKAERKSLACPCHGSAFAADGQLLQGPADRALASYPVKTDGKTVLVKTS
jgi:cytochrome b6-f complex iron-sulfur subunit